MTSNNSCLSLILPNLFFLFFVAQILSPAIGGKSIYLEVIIAFMDFNFHKWFIKVRKPVDILMLMVLSLALLNFILCFKILCTVITVAYLFYAYQNNLFYLKRYFLLSIFFAIAQFIFMYIAPDIAVSIGPTSISQTLWGKYSTATYTNFYAVMTDFVRVSGLSREAGFFASLLCCITILTMMEYRSQKTSVSKTWILLLAIAFFLSFSKISLVIIVCILIVIFSKQINKLPPLWGVFVFFVFMVFFWYHSPFLLDESNLSFIHRFGSYAIFADISDIKTLLLGSNSIDQSMFDGMYSIRFWRITSFDFFAGLAGAIFQYGLLINIFLFLLLYKMKISTTGMLLMLFLTLNVDMFTNQNFVSLAYFIAFKYFRGSTTW